VTSPEASIPSDAVLAQLAGAALSALAARHWRVALAESCTGGWIAKSLTDIAGSSLYFETGFVTYANGAKTALLGVDAGLLEREGAVSRATVLAMAAGARQRSGADLAVAVSGIAGPGGGSAAKPVGLVWFGWQSRDGVHEAAAEQFAGDRDAVRRQAVASALRRIAAQAAASGPGPNLGSSR